MHDRGSRVSFVTENTTRDDNPLQPRRARGRRRDPLGPDGEIGTRLRALYGEGEREPIPMKLIDLLEQLSEAERKAGK